MDTYSTHAALCAKFYDLTVDAQTVAEFVVEHSGIRPGHAGLFVGGMFAVARALLQKGLALTAVDYTDEMVDVGRAKLPGVPVEKADLRSLPFLNSFDVVLVIGRVFTHMLDDEDVSCALESCRRALHYGGRLFFDNYEDSKIQKTDYFNGIMECGEGATAIRRVSSTAKVSDSPYVVRWDAQYTGQYEGEPFSFSDSMQHRAFSRAEIARLLPRFGFRVLAQGDNFDETSFYTLAQAV